jgi:hypothetical protein
MTPLTKNVFDDTIGGSYNCIELSELQVAVTTKLLKSLHQWRIHVHNTRERLQKRVLSPGSESPQRSTAIRVEKGEVCVPAGDGRQASVRAEAGDETSDPV